MTERDGSGWLGLMPGDRAQQEGCKTESCEVCDVDADDNIASHVILKTLTLHLLDRRK